MSGYTSGFRERTGRGQCVVEEGNWQSLGSLIGVLFCGQAGVRFGSGTLQTGGSVPEEAKK
jgi:hypothetical protein